MNKKTLLIGYFLLSIGYLFIVSGTLYEVCFMFGEKMGFNGTCLCIAIGALYTVAALVFAVCGLLKMLRIPKR